MCIRDRGHGVTAIAVKRQMARAEVIDDHQQYVKAVAALPGRIGKLF